MSMSDEPLIPAEAEKRIRAIARDGEVRFHIHAQRAMRDDGLIAADVMNVLRAGYVDDSEFKLGSWRYRMRTQRICAPTRFLSETTVEVVTVWRVRR
jgi:hypothetical protein